MQPVILVTVNVCTRLAQLGLHDHVHSYSMASVEFPCQLDQFVSSPAIQKM